MGKYKYLFLDIDDTILDFKACERNAITKTIERYGLKATNELIESYSEINQSLWKAFERKEITKPELLSKRFDMFFRNLGVEIDPDKVNYNYLTYLSEEVFLINNAVELLEKIKDNLYAKDIKRNKPHEILVLSFTNASASEMKERIHKETSLPIEASTFHKLGINIITSVDNIKPKISMLNMREFISDKLEVLMKNPDYLRLLNNYMIHHKVSMKSEFDFKTEKEYKEYLQLNPPITLKRETVKSYGEMEIANFLYL